MKQQKQKKLISVQTNKKTPPPPRTIPTDTHTRTHNTLQTHIEQRKLLHTVAMLSVLFLIFLAVGNRLSTNSMFPLLYPTEKREKDMPQVNKNKRKDR